MSQGIKASSCWRDNCEEDIRPVWIITKTERTRTVKKRNVQRRRGRKSLSKVETSMATTHSDFNSRGMQELLKFTAPSIITLCSTLSSKTEQPSHWKCKRDIKCVAWWFNGTATPAEACSGSHNVDPHGTVYANLAVSHVPRLPSSHERRSGTNWSRPTSFSSLVPKLSILAKKKADSLGTMRVSNN